MTNIIIIILLIILIAMCAIIIMKLSGKNQNQNQNTNEILEKNFSQIKQDISSSGNENMRYIGEIVSGNQKNLNDLITGQLKNIGENLTEKQNTSMEMFTRMNNVTEQHFSSFTADTEQKLNNIKNALEKRISEIQSENSNQLKIISSSLDEKQNLSLDAFTKMNSLTEQRFSSFTTDTEQKLNNIRISVQKGLADIQSDTNNRLNQIQGVVEEKLQKTLDSKVSQAFSTVSSRLEQVYKELGEVQSIASGVTDLKKILSNVKTRGIFGELQLRNILKETLTPSQYLENVRIKSGFVEFAVIIPAENDEHILLPIDSKFPNDTYSNLSDALEKGSKSEIEDARKALVTRLKSEGKDISSKYINPPETTDFAVMFLPSEGLYAEAVNLNMVEILQREYHVALAGPSTMTALLNSLRMGFQSMAIRKQSDNVWKVLNDVKKEFEKFSDALENAQKKINTASSELETLVGTRTRMLRRQLQNVTELDNFKNNNDGE